MPLPQWLLLCMNPVPGVKVVYIYLFINGREKNGGKEEKTEDWWEGKVVAGLGYYPLDWCSQQN